MGYFTCVCINTPACSPIHELKSRWAQAVIGADGVGTLASLTQAGVLTLIHICISTHRDVSVMTHSAVNHLVLLQIKTKRFQTTLSESHASLPIQGHTVLEDMTEKIIRTFSPRDRTFTWEAIGCHGKTRVTCHAGKGAFCVDANTCGANTCSLALVYIFKILERMKRLDRVR